MKIIHNFWNKLKEDKEFFLFIRNIFLTFIILSSSIMVIGKILFGDWMKLSFFYYNSLRLDLPGYGLQFFPDSLPHHVQLNLTFRDFFPAIVVLIIATAITLAELYREQKRLNKKIIYYFLSLIAVMAVGHIYFWWIEKPCYRCSSGEELNPPLLQSVILIMPWVLVGLSILFSLSQKKKYQNIAEKMTKLTVAYWILMPSFLLMAGPFMWVTQILTTTSAPFVFALIPVWTSMFMR